MTTPTMTTDSRTQPQQYDAVAADYDRLIRPKYDAIAALVVDRARELTDLRRAHVVELSAGTGALTLQLAPLARSYVATDVSEPMLALARQRDVPGSERVEWCLADVRELRLEPGTERVEWCLADVRELRLEPTRADLVVSSLGPFQDHDDSLAGTLRLMRPGGVLVAVTWGDDYRELELLQQTRAQLGLPPRDTTSVTGLSRRLRLAGYRRVEVREVRLPVVHESVEGYVAYRRAFGPMPAPVAVEPDAALRALAERASAYTDRAGRVVLDWHLLVMSAER